VTIVRPYARFVTDRTRDFDDPGAHRHTGAPKRKIRTGDRLCRNSRQMKGNTKNAPVSPDISITRSTRAHIREEKPMSKKLISVALLITVLGVTTACAQDTATKAAAEDTTTTSPTPTAGDDAATTKATPSEAGSTPADDGVATFNEKFVYESGLEVTVSKVQRHRFSQYAAGYKAGDIGVSFKVKIKNGTGETFDSDLLTLDVIGGPDGEAAESVYDMSNDFDGFSGKITDGRSGTASFGVAFPKGTDIQPIQIQISPDFESDTSIFEGKV
jgi:hypothetical protein